MGEYLREEFPLTEQGETELCSLFIFLVEAVAESLGVKHPRGEHEEVSVY